MIAYATLGTNDMDRSIAFYDAAFGALGGVRGATSATWTEYRRAGERTKVCLVAPFDGQFATHGNGTMLAFGAPDHAAVDAFHAAALAQGGTTKASPVCATAPITSPTRATPTATSSACLRRSKGGIEVEVFGGGCGLEEEERACGSARRGFPPEVGGSCWPPRVATRTRPAPQSGLVPQKQGRFWPRPRWSFARQGA